MLSISKAFKGAGRANYYLNLAQEDYYLGGMEPAGFWIGDGATQLGLLGFVRGDEFRNLLGGISPDGKRRLVHNAGSEHRRSGWDLTWSVPKSVSVLWSQASPAVRTIIESELRHAVGRAAAFLATVGVVSRRGTNGVVHEPAKLVFACFEHSTSRALDPQLHVHSILINIGVRADGTTGTLEPRELYRHQMAAGALFRAELASRLEQSLGLRARRVERCFELIGVPAALMEEFSKRRAQIEAKLAELGIYTAAAAEKAALATRPNKQTLSREELIPRWQQVGRQYDWGPREIDWLRQHPFPARDVGSEARDSVPAALSALTSSDSHFSERQLIQALAEEAQGRGLGADAVLDLKSRVLMSPEVVPLRAVLSVSQWTTPEMLRLEARVLELASVMAARERPLPSPIPEGIGEISLSTEQQGALLHVVSSSGGLRIISGMAGTGKSTVFKAAREVWASQGREVLGMCLAGKAACELARATGIPAETVQRSLMRFERHAELLTPNTVVLMDEAAMVGTRQMATLLEQCARSGATLVLCGDPRQLQPIEAGGVFPELADRYGAAHLVEIRRQREDWARGAVVAFAEGRAADALAAYEARGAVSFSEDADLALERICARRVGANEDQDAGLVLANRVADADRINRAIQQSRLAGGQLSGSGIAVGDQMICVGDRILFTKNCAKLEVWNGQVAEVTAASREGITACIDGKTLIKFKPREYPHIRLGYALTTHKAQALTVERTQIYADASAENREAAYVQASRARGETHFHVVAEDREQLIASMQRSRPKVMATTLLPTPDEGPILNLKLEL
ncbi:MAG: relaxase domain-containing protein [Verrucomicrobiales bacterium]|nr:relaxase domain-containing protein [Verrucomicrobiales bacterium]